MAGKEPKVSRHSFSQLVRRADPDFAFEGLYPKVYLFSQNRHKRDSGPLSGVYTPGSTTESTIRRAAMGWLGMPIVYPLPDTESSEADRAHMLGIDLPG